MKNELRDALTRMRKNRRMNTMPDILGAPYKLNEPQPINPYGDMRKGLWGYALEQELAAFDEVIGFQNIAEHMAFDPEKFLDECHKNEADSE